MPHGLQLFSTRSIPSPHLPAQDQVPSRCPVNVLNAGTIHSCEKQHPPRAMAPRPHIWLSSLSWELLLLTTPESAMTLPTSKPSSTLVPYHCAGTPFKAWYKGHLPRGALPDTPESKPTPPSSDSLPSAPHRCWLPTLTGSFLRSEARLSSLRPLSAQHRPDTEGISVNSR